MCSSDLRLGYFRAVSQDVRRDLLPVAAIHIPAGEPALQVMQDQAITQVDGGMVGNGRSHLHQEHIANFHVLGLNGAQRLKACRAEVVEVQVLAALPPLVKAVKVRQVNTSLCPMPVPDHRVAIEYAVCPCPTDQLELATMSSRD